MKYKLFGNEILIKDHHCNFNDQVGMKVNTPYVNLYVRLTDECQAKCRFCTFHGKDKGFDEYKFLYTLSRLSEQIKINKVSFTGGEPTVKIDLLNRLLEEVKSIDKNIWTVVNTNGYDFLGIKPEYTDSIALSRHHWSNPTNNEIFGLDHYGYWITDSKDILEYPHKDKLHLSCNLIKGYTDSAEKCKKFIDFFGAGGVNDFGFVSLMGNNQYSKDHFVDFSTIDLGSMPDTMKAAHYSKGSVLQPTCKCANYLTCLDDGSIVKSYARYYISRDECKGILVYDTDGKLKNGFDGEVIYE
ncbi:putative Molybdenum cofactor biosynthesis protein A [Candidatus Desulfosporosinus infrequens]|uniref:Putative Molybdenum cofactor biosynthesis protein A n=1 Tax=Candidatus Desulfosporosinus infrequens TaxID=2043169 RepID=A0A2U3LRI5_9FIRM|nr:putative Molybdenum cofactor biosynthesis protein A [Candidatus Desulfosporosinus infrequens]